MDNKLIVSSSPHINSPVKTKNIMIDVIIALIPALIASVVIFGPRALIVSGVSVLACVLAEYISRKVMKRLTFLRESRFGWQRWAVLSQSLL